MAKPNNDFHEIKIKLYEYCSSYVENIISRVSTGINEAQTAANGESKSSAGDKYETGRAMAHLEKEKYQSQLMEATKLRKTLSSFTRDVDNKTAKLGSLVITEKSRFFLSIPVGKISLEGNDYFAISPGSPIGSQLFDKKEGDIILFNGKSMKILLII